jgi:hypothetical protein
MALQGGLPYNAQVEEFTSCPVDIAPPWFPVLMYRLADEQ